MRRELSITLCIDDEDNYTVEIYEGETGDHVSKTVDYDPTEHPEFNEWIGNEIYSWFEIMTEEKEEFE